jgi:hypothetical protein
LTRIVHPSRHPELAHAGVDDRIAGLPALPGKKKPLILAPGKRSILLAKGSVRQIGRMKQQMIGELPPRKLAQKRLVSGGAPVRVRMSKRRVPALRRRDLAEMEMRREA